MTAEPIPFDFDLAKRFTDCRSFRFAPGVLLYGGDPIVSAQLKDLWAWDGTKWTQMY